MTTNGHAAWEDTLAAYLLGALPEEELSEFEAHLEGCKRCRAEAASLTAAVDVLPVAVPQVNPPDALRGRIMAVVESEAELLAAAGGGADRPARARKGRRGWRGWFPRPVVTAAAATVALAIGVVAGAGIVGGGDGGGGGQRTLAARVSYPAARASVVVDGSHAKLVVHGMPAPSAGRVYQVWLNRDGAPVPAGTTFMLRSGDVSIPRSVRGGDRVMVTSEPMGGSPTPTRLPIVVAQPV